MKKNNYIVTVIICLLPILAGIILYEKLPNEIPIHFDVNNMPDNYASKNFALFGLPVIMAFFQIIVCVTTWFTKRKMSSVPKLVRVLEYVIPVISILIYYVMIAYTLYGTIDVGRVVCLMTSILFCVLGNYFPKVSYESHKNLIHPSPKNEKAFKKMTKTFGYSFIGVGIVFLIITFFV